MPAPPAERDPRLVGDGDPSDVIGALHIQYNARPGKLPSNLCAALTTRRVAIQSLLCEAGRVGGGVDGDRVAACGGAQEREDAADEEAFEGSEGFLVGFAVGFAAGEVLARWCVDARLGDGDDVDGVVELAVAMRLRRWRCCLPEEASRGAMPA